MFVVVFWFLEVSLKKKIRVLKGNLFESLGSRGGGVEVVWKGERER